MVTRLFLTGITAEGRHGANPREKDEPQGFVVDLDRAVGKLGPADLDAHVFGGGGGARAGADRFVAASGLQERK